MKYMGSKRGMLLNGLGDALGRSAGEARRVLDLFTGSAAVAWYVAERHGKQVLAGDLQKYSAVLAAAVIERTAPVLTRDWVKNWIRRARMRATAHGRWSEILKCQSALGEVAVSESAFIARCMEFGDDCPLSKAYGGYYFSPLQAVWIDALRASLPKSEDVRNIALASLIQAASRCAASPGHTAQPFKPNDTAGRFLVEAWRRDILATVRACVEDIAPRMARKKGRAYCLGAAELAESARSGDLVFLDPPYSGVHYSRFYHVLESVACGAVGEVSGAGRYPDQDLRPQSAFSKRTTARGALNELLGILARKGANVIITFPAGRASNGLSGDDVKVLAAEHFQIQEEKVTSRFSTLGGDLKHRAARQSTDELILKLSAVTR